MQKSEEIEKDKAGAARADYGIDAPEVVRHFAVMGGAGILFAALTPIMARETMPAAVQFLSRIAPSLGVAALFFLATALNNALGQ